MHATHASIVSKIAHRVYERQPELMLKGAWWQHLQPNFYRLPEPFQLCRKEQPHQSAVAPCDRAGTARGAGRSWAAGVATMRP